MDVYIAITEQHDSWKRFNIEIVTTSYINALSEILKLGFEHQYDDYYTLTEDLVEVASAWIESYELDGHNDTENKKEITLADKKDKVK